MHPEFIAEKTSFRTFTVWYDRHIAFYGMRHLERSAGAHGEIDPAGNRLFLVHHEIGDSRKEVTHLLEVCGLRPGCVSLQNRLLRILEDESGCRRVSVANQPIALGDSPLPRRDLG